MPENIKRILLDLKDGLKGMYRNRLRNLLLYGSYARGDAKADSDIDVAMIMDDFGDIGKEIEITGDLVSRLSLKNNVVISLHPIREKDWQKLKSSFILNLKKEGASI